MKVLEFSRFVQGFKDHFTIETSAYHASGVLGEERIIVTYGKLGSDEAEEDRPGATNAEQAEQRSTIADFEAQLSCAGLGPVVYLDESSVITDDS